MSYLLDHLEYVTATLLGLLLWMGRRVLGMRDDIKDLKAWKEQHEREWGEYKTEMVKKVDGMSEKVTDIWKALAKGEVVHEQ